MSVTCGQCDARPSQLQGSPPIGWYQIILLGNRGTCVTNLPRVALDSGEAKIWTHDLLIVSPASQPVSHRATHGEGNVQQQCTHLCQTPPPLLSSSVTQSAHEHTLLFKRHHISLLLLVFDNSIMQQIQFICEY